MQTARELAIFIDDLSMEYNFKNQPPTSQNLGWFEDIFREKLETRK